MRLSAIFQRGFFVGLSLLCGGCAGFDTTATEVAPPVDWPLRNSLDWSKPRIPVTFEGVVLQRYRAPGFWSGIAASFQAVRYRVDKVETGPIKPGEAIVFHVVVGPPLCEPDTPELSRTIFKVGQGLRIKAELTEKGELVSWEKAENAQVIQQPSSSH